MCASTLCYRVTFYINDNIISAEIARACRIILLTSKSILSISFVDIRDTYYLLIFNFDIVVIAYLPFFNSSSTRYIPGTKFGITKYISRNHDVSRLRTASRYIKFRLALGEPRSQLGFCRRLIAIVRNTLL